MFVIDFSNHLAEKHQPVRRVRIGPDSRMLAATFGEEFRVAEAGWWDLADRRFAGRSAVFPVGWDDGCYTDEFAEPIFTPDLARCVVHGYSPGSGSAEYHYLVVVEPGRDYAEGVGLGFPAKYYDQPSFEAFTLSPDGRWLYSGQSGECFTEARRGWLCRWDLQQVEFGPKTNADEEDDEEGVPEPELVEDGSVTLVPQSEDDGSPYENESALAVSPDGRRIACGQPDGVVRLYTLEPRRLLLTLPAPQMKNATVRSLTFSPDGSSLSILIDGGVAVVNAATGEAVGRLKSTDLTGVAFHPDGRRLFTTGQDQLVRVWDTSVWTEVTNYAWDIGPLQSVTVSADGMLAAAGGTKSRVVVWDLDE